MSVWQRPQAALVVKKSAGMMPPRVVSADEGKNGPLGPAPSPAIETGGVAGF